MGQLFLFIVVALTVAAIVFGVTVMLSGGDSGLTPVEPDGRALPLPGDRPLGEEDVVTARFDTAVRGYRMAQVDQALQRAAYDIGYKGELIGVLEAEVNALREGRTADADVLRRAREAAVQPPPPEPDTVVEGIDDGPVVLSADSADPSHEKVAIELAPAPAVAEPATRAEPVSAAEPTTAAEPAVQPEASGPAAEVAEVPPPVADDVIADDAPTKPAAQTSAAEVPAAQTPAAQTPAGKGGKPAAGGATADNR
jgi:DivIVA domain-containing protein